MDISYSEDKLTKHVNSISDTMMRFISKEGVNQFPTVVFLLNRMFLSEENPIAKHLNLTEKLKVGDNFHWYRYKDIYTGFKLSIPSLIESASLFKSYNDNTKLSSISKVFQRTVNSNYYLTSSGELYFGDINNLTKIEMVSNETPSIVDILKYNDSYDIIMTKTKLYFLDSNTKTLKEMYKDESRTFNDICVYNEFIVLATSKYGIVLKLNANNTLSKYNELEYNSRTYTGGSTGTEDDDSDGSGSSGTATDVTITNGLPISNVMTKCIMKGSLVYIGNESTCGYYQVNSTFGDGTDAETGIEFHDNVCGISSYKLTSDSTYTIGNLQLIADGIKSLSIDNNCVHIVTLSDEIHSYLKTNGLEPVYKLKSINGIPQNINYITCDGENSIIVVDTSGSIYESRRISDDDYPIKLIPIAFVYKDESDTTKVNAVVEKLTVRQLSECLSDDSFFNKKFSTVNSKPIKFMCVLSTNGSKTDFKFIGDDDRQDAATELKAVQNVFDIG